MEVCFCNRPWPEDPFIFFFKQKTALRILSGGLSSNRWSSRSMGRTQFFQLHKLTHTEVQASHPTRTEVQVGLSSIQAAASSAVI